MEKIGILTRLRIRFDFVDRFIWYLEQMFPLSYTTEYFDEDGYMHFVLWKMWLGRCYNIRDFIVWKDVSHKYKKYK